MWYDSITLSPNRKELTMGTRGLYGFRKNGIDKLTYNHLDSYPDWLGKKVVE